MNAVIRRAFSASFETREEGDKGIGMEKIRVNENAEDNRKAYEHICSLEPGVVEEFLYDSRFLGSQKMYFILTCGSSTGQAASHAETVCKKLSMTFNFKILNVFHSTWFAATSTK